MIAVLANLPLIAGRRCSKGKVSAGYLVDQSCVTTDEHMSKFPVVLATPAPDIYRQAASLFQQFPVFRSLHGMHIPALLMHSRCTQHSASPSWSKTHWLRYHGFIPAPSLPGGHRSSNRVFPTSDMRLAGKTILVTGATGATGRLVCAALQKRGATVRAFVRPRTYMRARNRIESLLEICPSVKLIMGDLRDITTVRKAVYGCDGVISASGTRNFEAGSDNHPEAVDYKGLKTLASCFFESQLEQDLVMMFSGGTNSFAEEQSKYDTKPMEKATVATSEDYQCSETSRFVLISSLGVTRPERFPQLQQMGSVLTYKLCGEDALRDSGCAFTIVRPGGLTDMPAGQLPVIFDQGDRIAGSISRADVAEICAEAIFLKSATNVTLECVSPRPDMIASSQRTQFSPDMFDQLIPEEMN